jgi:hypothetical protein
MGVISGVLDLEALLSKPIGQIPQFSLGPKIEITGSGSWKIAGQAAALTISIDAGTNGALALVQPGAPLFQFPNNIDGSKGAVQKARKGDQDCPYLRLSFTVKYSVDAGMKFSFGSLGVSGDASVGRTFTVDNYFACDSTMLLVDAILAAFNAFALPFNPANASSMPDGAFLDYVFSGKMAFSAGLNYGLSLGAASLGQLKTSFDADLVTGGISPSVKIGASMDVKFEADDSFQIIVGRQRSAGQNIINLCVSKVDKKDLGLDLGVELSASLGAQFDLQNTLKKVLEKAAGPAIAGLTNTAREAALANFVKGLGQDAINQYVQEAQKEINNFLDKVNKQKADFTVAYENSRTNTQLFNYVINCDLAAALNTGYRAAIQCDFLSAMRVDGVDLQAGSFLDDELSQKTTITLQFFNIFNATDATEFFQNLKTVYAGSGIFRVIFDTGIDWRSVFNGRSEDLKVFFEATSQTSDQATFQSVAVTLNFVMADTKDTKRAALTAKALRLLNSSDLNTLLGKITDTVQVTAKVAPEAFAELKFDTVKIGNQLNSGPHDNDRRNYETFAANVAVVRSDSPFAGGFRTYDNWVTYNRRANDQEGSTRPPDRADSGNLNVMSVWPDAFSAVQDLATRSRISIDFEAGRQFMNLCESLRRLNDQTLDETMTKQFFNDLLDSLSSVVKNSPTVLSWYSKACFSALTQLMLARVADVTGSATPQDPVDISFELEHQIAVSASSRG